MICTIHQPSPATYALFDKLLLLAEGRVIYFGPSRDVVNYFITSPFQFPYQAGSNPANYLSKWILAQFLILFSILCCNPYFLLVLASVSVAGSFLLSANGKKISGTELANYYSNGDLCRVFMENIDTMVSGFSFLFCTFYRHCPTKTTITIVNHTVCYCVFSSLSLLLGGNGPRSGRATGSS